MIDLIIEGVKDELARENFGRLIEQLSNMTFLKGDWRFIEFSVGIATTNFKFAHGLNFIPKDVIVTSSLGAGVATFNIASFTRTHIDVTTTGACAIRAYIGSYRE